MSTRPKLRRLLDLPGVADLEMKALMKPRHAEPDARAEFPDIDATAQTAFGLTVEAAETIGRPTDWDGIETLAGFDLIDAFAAEGWDVTDDRRKPLRLLSHFALPLALAMRGVAGELPFQPEDTTPEPWSAGLAAEAKRFRKR